ncbi:MAG: alkaline phosphatase family protein [Terriglobales bacterium]
MPPAAFVPRFDLVVLVMLENTRYDDVAGNPVMPYFNSLADRYGLATQYFANTHPSIGNYFMLTTGQIITNDNGFPGPVTDDNLARRMIAAGVSWRAYLQGLPSAGYVGGDAYPYVKRHNPFAYFSDVLDSAEQRNNLVPLDQFPQDLAMGSLPRFVYVLPDQHNNGHDCPAGMATCTLNDKLAAVDDFLRTTLDPLLASPAFQRSLVIVNWDESAASDIEHGGGRIAVLLAGPRVRPGHRSVAFYQHQSGLRLMLEAMNIASFPGASAGAPGMAEFFTQQP